VPGNLVALPPSDRPSIAVLPFTNLSDDEEQDYFAEGLTDDLITDLSKISGLFVIARNSVFTYQGRSVDTRDVARELGVRYVLEGSVRRAGNIVRINAQLIDGSTGSHLWAERYDRPLADIFEIQDQVIENIVAALSVQLTDIERTTVAQPPTSNLEAYDYFLRGETLAYRADLVSANDALEFYQRAMALDPQFADAYAGYARVAVDVLSFDFADSLPSAVARKRAYEAASRAVSLDPGLARSYSVLGLLQMLEGQHETAVNSARKAVALNPNSAESHLNLAVVLIHAGHQDEALREMEAVLRFNPKPPNHVHDYYGLALFMNRRYGEALAALQQEPVGTRSDLHLELLAAVNARLGNQAAARAAIDSLLERWPDSNLAWYRIMFAHYAREEDRMERLEALRLAGLPEWPRGFEDRQGRRLSGEAIDELARGRTWTGQRDGSGPFTQYMQADGRFVERGPDYQLAGTASVKGDMLCMQSPAVLMGREYCGPVVRNPSATPAGRDEYIYPTATSVKRFSAAP
jgi:adenylate cyclase